jgi:hypothetical protein
MSIPTPPKAFRWANYTGEEAVQPTEADTGAALAPEYLDVYVSSVRDSDPFGFSVQVLDDKSESRVMCHVWELISRRCITREAHE